MAPRPQPYRIESLEGDISPERMEQIDEMFQILFDDVRNGAIDINENIGGFPLTVEHGGTNTTEFTEGSVVFAGPDGLTLTEDNDHLFYDDAQNFLGVGTSSPDGPLDVTGTLSVDQGFGIRLDVLHDTATAGTVYGARFDATASHSSGTMVNTVGLTNSARYAGTSTAAATNMSGMQCFVCLDDVTSPAGTITTVQGGNFSQIGNFATGAPAVTVSQARGVIIGDIGNGNGSNGLTVSNASAISVAGSQTAATNSCVMTISNTTSVPFAGSGTWCFYNASTRNNHWAGPIYMGHTTTWGSGTNFISFADGTVPGTPASNTAAIYANDVAGTVEMFAINEAGVSTQLTGVTSSSVTLAQVAARVALGV